MRWAATAPVLLLVLAACGSGPQESSGPATATASAAAPAAGPTTPAPTGEPVPEALSRFRCDPDGAGTYTASGIVANTTKGAVTFQVTVYVGQPADLPQPGRTKQVPKVAAGDSVEFQIDQIPMVEGGTCRVQVVTTK